MSKSESNHAGTYAVVGELVMIANAIDHLLNQVLIAAFHLERTPLLEPVVATLDARQKIEMLRSRSKIIRASDWKRGFVTFCDKAESVYRQRNIVCHTPASLEDDVWKFWPNTATKMLKRLDFENKSLNVFPFQDVKDAIKTGEAALGAGVVLLENLSKLDAELKRKGNKSTISVL